MTESLEVLAQKANKLYSTGKYRQAKDPLKQILVLQPKNDSVLNMLAFAENQCGRRNVSYELLDKAIALNPKNFNSYDLKGFLLLEDRNFDAAVEMYKKALSINPNMPNTHKNLGMTYFRQEAFSQAIKSLALAVVGQPENREFKQLYTSASADCPLTAFDENDKTAIKTCFEDPALSHKFLTNNWTLILYNDPAFRVLRDLDTNKVDKAFFTKNESNLKQAFSNQFLLLGLQRNYIANLFFEKSFTNLRRMLLELTVCDGYDLNEFKDFIASMAIQSWINEYVFSVSEEEEIWIKQLTTEIESKSQFEETDILSVCVLACYSPLYKLRNASEILSAAKSMNSSLLKNLMVLQIEQPLEEQKIKEIIPALNAINNKVSSEVRGQYEENPYPRWQSINNDLKINIMSDKTLDILVAGCGTGQEPASLTQVYPNANFVCVDLSLSSIAYAIRQTQKIGLSDRLEFMQADILNLGALNKQFDVIYSSGVLHHMEDPEAGLKVLRDILKSNGKIYISLYSEKARQNVVAARKYIKDNNISSTPEGIRQMRDIIKNTNDDILKKSLEAADFFTLSQCRDLIFHVQEHRFTLQQVKEILARNSLKFGGMFALDNKKATKFKKDFPNEEDLISLDKWNIFEEENPDLFKHGMYSFIFEKE